MRARLLLRLVLPLCVYALAACGSGPAEPSGGAVVTIGPGGLSPAEVRIKAWGQVTFVNNDSRPHAIASDPVDVHSECPPVNRVGLLNSGESRTTGTLNLTGVCGFHDHLNHADPTLRGRIVVE